MDGLLFPSDAGGVLMRADNGAVDHLHGAVVSSRQSVHNPPPDTCSAPANEAVVASGVMDRTPELGQAEVPPIA